MEKDKPLDQLSVPLKKRTLELPHRVPYILHDESSQEYLDSISPELSDKDVRLEPFRCFWHKDQSITLEIPVIEKETQEYTKGTSWASSGEYVTKFISYMESHEIVVEISQTRLWFKKIKSGKNGIVFLLGGRGKDSITHAFKLSQQSSEMAIMLKLLHAQDFCPVPCRRPIWYKIGYPPFKSNREFSHILMSYTGKPLSSFPKHFRQSKKVLLLIFLAFRMLERDGLLHHDIHDGNFTILIESGYYHIVGKQHEYRIPSSFRLFCIDFGRVRACDSSINSVELAGSMFIEYVQKVQLPNVSLLSIERELEMYKIQ